MMKSKPQKRHSPQRGAALAELAVALPVLFVVLLGAVDFGRLWTEGLALSNAVSALLMRLVTIDSMAASLPRRYGEPSTNSAQPTTSLPSRNGKF